VFTIVVVHHSHEDTVPTVRNGPVIGLVVQVAVLAGLAGTVGLGTAGWLAGLACGVVTCAALTMGLHRTDAGDLGPADRVTLARATLVGGVTALVVDAFSRPAPVGVMVALTTVALVLDAVDGQVARRTGTVTELGARFDMEVDAFLILVLSVHVARPLGSWVLVIGGMRYAFVAASWVLPWMRGQLPPRFWRKVVAAVQGVVLGSAVADVLPRSQVVAATAAALALLVESFGRDVVYLWWHRPTLPRPRHWAGSLSRVGPTARMGIRVSPGTRPAAAWGGTVGSRPGHGGRRQPVPR
jgi:phosphatidylglycerophosphate synthase